MTCLIKYSTIFIKFKLKNHLEKLKLHLFLKVSAALKTIAEGKSI